MTNEEKNAIANLAGKLYLKSIEQNYPPALQTTVYDEMLGLAKTILDLQSLGVSVINTSLLPLTMRKDVYKMDTDFLFEIYEEQQKQKKELDNAKGT